MHVDDYVQANKEVIKFVQNAVPGAIDKYVGTLDYATARFNTVLLKISQDPLMLDEYMPEARECFDAIQSFYTNTQRLILWPWLFKPVVKVILHRIGTRRIPKIKQLLEKVDNYKRKPIFGEDTV
jgi:hypothetical protein|tara:strand:- start:436 stop:810 length:375 start_codon:yes stop_codon:yes gene_type:complete